MFGLGLNCKNRSQCTWNLFCLPPACPRVSPARVNAVVAIVLMRLGSSSSFPGRDPRGDTFRMTLVPAGTTAREDAPHRRIRCALSRTWTKNSLWDIKNDNCWQAWNKLRMIINYYYDNLYFYIIVWKFCFFFLFSSTLQSESKYFDLSKCGRLYFGYWKLLSAGRGRFRDRPRTDRPLWIRRASRPVPAAGRLARRPERLPRRTPRSDWTS